MLRNGLIGKPVIRKEIPYILRDSFSFDVSELKDNYFELGDFNEYNIVSIVVEWSNLDNVDAVVKLIMREGDRWIDVPDLDYTLNTTNGACKLTHADWSSVYAGVYINKGSNTTGVINVYVKGIMRW